MTTIDRAGMARDLEWTETFTDRGDGSSDVTGWEAATPFGTYYSVEMGFGSDSFYFAAKHDCDLISDRDDADSAKADAQAHFEKAIAAALRQPDQKGEASDLLARAEKAEQAVRWCRSRLKTDAYRTTLDKHLTLPPGPLLPGNERLVRSAPQPAPEAGKLPSEEAWEATHRHVRTGGEYRVIGLARLQSSGGAVSEDVGLMIYDHPVSGLWARPHEEFNDGRFEALLSPAQPHDVPCARCAGTSWVCENHPDKAWTAEGCECGAGMPCPDCDQRRQPQPHDMPAGDGAFEQCAKLCEERASYHEEGFRGGARHYDREDAARSYRATAGEIRKLARASRSTSGRA